ncbi:MAG TPA: protein kinase [Polyangiaceae bacterium]|nr:protein kinase [Polyangiaceae bacterium]
MRVIGRYALFNEIASGGMATVHLGRLLGPAGFSRTVAIKRLHPQFAKDPEFVSMFLDEARLASRIQHPNVVSTLDVITVDDEIFLVMDYVYGESLARLVRDSVRAQELVPPGHATSVIAGVLYGLHAAHEAKSARGEALHMVHRDVSPQNVLVGTDGVARVLDFGVAKAALRSQSTRQGQTKGKFSYMAPEQMNGQQTDRRTDIFSVGIVLWEILCGRRLFTGANMGEICNKVLHADIPAPSTIVPLAEGLDRIVMRALDREPKNRYQTAREFAIALEQAGPVSTAREVGEWVERFAESELAKRSRLLAELESRSSDEADMPPSEIARVPRSDVQRVLAGSPFAELNPEHRSDSAAPPSLISRIVPSHPSHFSAVTVASGSAPASSRFGRWLAAGVVLCVALGAGVALGLRSWSSKPPRVEAAPAPPQASIAKPVPAPTVSAPVMKLEELPLVPSETNPTPAPVSESSNVAAVPKRRSKVRSPMVSAPRSAVPKARTPSQRPAAKPAANCDPPWVVDANGIRRPKAECL